MSGRCWPRPTAKLRSREEDLKNREEMLRKRLDQKIDERLREARREIDAVVGRLKARTETMATQAERAAARLIPTGETGGARADARAALDAIEDRLHRSAAAVPGGAVAAPAAPAEPSRLAVAGDRVVVGALGLEGVVLSISGRDAEVDVRGKRLRARVSDLRVIGGAARRRPRSGSTSTCSLARVSSPS